VIFQASYIPPALFSFAGDTSGVAHADRFRGLRLHGPYARPSGNETPTIGFVFPSEFRDDANHLYLAIRNGVGSFPGMSSTFQIPIEKDRVFPITDFSLTSHRVEDHSKIYTDAILNSLSSQRARPDILLVIHPKTSPWQDRTPYYASKAALLESGMLSQDVTVELIRNESQFQWSVANIALALFVKLGGVPWVVNRRRSAPQVVLGVGHSHTYDPKDRQTDRQYAFTTCVRADGPFEFNIVSRPVSSRKDYLNALGAVVDMALSRIRKLEQPVSQIALHLPKRFGWEERAVVDSAIKKEGAAMAVQVEVLQVTAEEDFFVLDSAAKTGLPNKGICVRLDKTSHLLYTEGRDELKPWQNRMPTAVRVRYFGTSNDQVVYDLLSQVFDLSQVNYRGFNAASTPVTLVYSSLVAKLLAHLPHGWLDKLTPEQKRELESRMWFL
jgi:hypothetical protein